MALERIFHRVLKWVINSVDKDAEVVEVRRLQGGISSIVHSITLKKDDLASEFVLRQFDNLEWLENEPDLVLHEAESLRRAARVVVNTPGLIAFDSDGNECGARAVLMTRLKGKVELQPESMEKWLDGMAESLVKIHQVEGDDFPWSYFTYNDLNLLEIPSWSSFPESWERAFSIVKRPMPKFKPCFIHRDYHPTNILWQGDRVSGVVDWVNACKGPAGIDIGHCRINLALLFGTDTADKFLAAYQYHAGEAFTYDPYWDLLSIVNIMDGPPQVYPGWTAFGITGLTDALMAERLDQYLNRLLKVPGTTSGTY
jgi:aminoglycoside phosphotransferase (APT) family kinase protein